MRHLCNHYQLYDLDDLTPPESDHLADIIFIVQHKLNSYIVLTRHYVGESIFAYITDQFGRILGSRYIVSC